MKRLLFVTGLVMLSGLSYGQASRSAAVASQDAAMSVASQQALVKQYCIGCHNDTTKSGDFSFEKIDMSHPDQHAQQVEKVILKLRTGMMPPAGRPRPNPETVKAFTSALEAEIDRVA